KTTIIGKVFHDLDGDGLQGAGERGIAGVRLATLEGLLVETDAQGRYHIADVDTGRADRGANFMIKLDALSLPEGLDARRVLRQVVRLTPGLMTRINFPLRTAAQPDEPSLEESPQVRTDRLRAEARTDGLRGEPRLDVLALPGSLPASEQGVQSAEFAVYSNYGLFISGYQLALFDLTDPGFPRPIGPPELLFLRPVDGRTDLQTATVDVPVGADIRRIGYRLIALGSCESDDNLPTGDMLRLLEDGAFDPAAVRQARSSPRPPGMGVRWVFDRTAMRLLDVRRDKEPVLNARSPWEIFGHSNLEIQTIPVRGYQTIQRRRPDTEDIVVDVEPVPVPELLRVGGEAGDLQASYALIDQQGTRSDRRPLPRDAETWAVFDHEGLDTAQGGIVEFDPQRAVGSIRKELRFEDAAGARGLHRTVMECGCTLMAADTIIDRQNQTLSLRLTNFSELSQTPTLVFDGEDAASGRTLQPMGLHMSQEIFLGRFDPAGYASSPVWRDLRVRFPTATPAGYVPEFQLERTNTFEPKIRASCDGVGAWPDTTRQENLLAAMVVGGRDEPQAPPPDALFAMGLVNLTVGVNDVSGILEALDADDHYDESVFVDGRIAGYLRGKIRGRYLVTAQIDSTEDELKNLGDNLQRKDPERIFRQLDPDRYYPVYGDDSTTTADVESQGAMYLRVDWDASSGLWGNYNTGFTDTEFAQYNRSLYGAKLDYSSTQTNQYGEHRQSLKLFASEAQTRSAQASFRATGGSLYYLPHRDIVQGSEKLWIEVRARDSERVLDTEILLPGRDYEIDDLQGRILLSRPLSSVVRERSNSIVRSAPLEGDRVFLLADYEHVPDDFAADDLSSGIRGRWASDTLALGLTRVDDQRDGRDYTLTGTDAHWRFSERSFIRGEYARSEARQNDVNSLSFDGGLTFTDALLPEASDDLSGTAWGLEAHIDLADLPLSGAGGDSSGAAQEGALGLWHKKRDEGFSSGRLGESGEVVDSGMSLDVAVSEVQTLSTSLSRVERELGPDESVVRAQTDLRLGCDSPAG
ncbi:MAG: hypothetical protein KDI31_17140, partial [Pseudomonadales bacterium]|nr:hypothetical protein [Pseudomonadales bacterium]